MSIKGHNASGVTHSERYLAKLCEHSFLSLWSHPNLYRTPAKELADLVVVFGDRVVIFSDKNCHFDEISPHGWSRWYRRSVIESAQQLFRAEGWIRKHPNRIYLDAKCEQPFPLQLPSNPRVHLIAVALGASEACRRHFQGGSGSLVIDMDADGREPFRVGDIDNTRSFVHVFDDVSLDLVLRELDTITDFLRYLERKELYARSGMFLGATGEEDLLACYLAYRNDDGQNDFIIPDDGRYVLVGEQWVSYLQSREYIQNRNDNRVSYFWDYIIEWIASHAINGTLISGGERPLSIHEEELRALAGEPRHTRRRLSVILHDAFAKAERQAFFARTIISSDLSRYSYIFVILERSSELTEDQYREARQQVLHAYCGSVKSRNPKLKKVVGLAFGPFRSDSSIDSIVIDFDTWTADDIARAGACIRMLGWSGEDRFCTRSLDEIEHSFGLCQTKTDEEDT